MVPVQVEQFPHACLFFFVVLTGLSLIDAAICADYLVLRRLITTGETVGIALANYNLFLPAEYLVHRRHRVFIHLTHFAYHDLELDDAGLGRFTRLQKFFELVIDFIFAWKGSHLFIDG